MSDEPTAELVAADLPVTEAEHVAVEQAVERQEVKAEKKRVRRVSLRRRTIALLGAVAVLVVGWLAWSQYENLVLLADVHTEAKAAQSDADAAKKSAATAKTIAAKDLKSQNNHHASTVKAEAAQAAQAAQIISLEMQLLAAHSDTATLLTRLTGLTEEAATLGPALTQGQSALLDNIAAIDFTEAEIQQQITQLQAQVTALEHSQP